MKKLWNIYHVYDVDGGCGDAVEVRQLVGTILATDEDIDKFVEHWNHPRVYDKPYADLTEHTIVKEEVKIVEHIAEFEPYDPKTRLWPDLPSIGDGIYPWFEYDEKTHSWFDPNEEE